MSDYIQGADRKQRDLLPDCLEDYVDQEAPVRFIDAYVESLDLRALEFSRAQVAATGRRPYDPGCLLKLYLYGYLNRVRSSRRLEAECHRNLEVLWLMGKLKPDHKTISDFRKDNRKALVGLFKEFNVLCRRLDLFGAELVAIDGSKIKALNSPDRNFNAKRLAQALERVEKGVEKYLQQLDHGDEQAEGSGSAVKVADLQGRLDKLQRQRERLQGLQNQLEASGAKQISETDPDSRSMKKVKVGYNTQTAVDSKHALIVAQDVCQDANDFGQLAPMAQAAKQCLQGEDPQVVADSGYEAADQLEACEQEGITAIVPPKRNPSGKTNKGKSVYPKERFIYEPQRDAYRCPAGELLPNQGTYQKRGKAKQRYENPRACGSCPLRSECTTASHRTITRLPNEAAVERSRERAEQHKETIRKRGAIVEHPFGTLKNWGYGSFLLTTLEKVRGEFSLMCLSYNLRRALNVLGTAKLIEALR